MNQDGLTRPEHGGEQPGVPEFTDTWALLLEEEAHDLYVRCLHIPAPGELLRDGGLEQTGMVPPQPGHQFIRVPCRWWSIDPLPPSLDGPAQRERPEHRGVADRPVHALDKEPEAALVEQS